MSAGRCTECAKKDAAIKALQEALAMRPVEVSPEMRGLLNRIGEGQKEQSYYDRCGCSPKNGGSGICGCINGEMKVTC